MGSLNKNISLKTTEKYSDNIEYALTVAKERESKTFSLNIADEFKEFQASFGGGKEKDLLNTKNTPVYLGIHPKYSEYPGFVGCITDMDIKNHIIPSGGNSEIHFGDDLAGKLLTRDTEGFEVLCSDQCPDRVNKKKARKSLDILTTESSIIDEEEATTADVFDWWG